MNPIDTAVGYLRVSTGRQQLSPEAQRAAIERFAAREGFRIVAWHDDTGLRGARSGWLPLAKRPGLAHAMADIEAGRASVLIVDVRDRLARNLGESLLLQSLVFTAGGRILSACGTANGDSEMDVTMRNLQYVFADAERRFNARRIREVFSLKRERGECTGNPPFGLRYNAENRLEVNPDEERKLYAIASLRRRGFGYGGIRDALNRWGIPNREGKVWHLNCVRNLCDRLRLVATRPGGPFPRNHVELQRPIVWDVYRRALKAGWRIHPPRSERPQRPRRMGQHFYDGRR